MVENSDANSRVMSNFIGLSTGVQILSVVLVCSSFFYMASKLRIAPKDVMAKADSLQVQMIELERARGDADLLYDALIDAKAVVVHADQHGNLTAWSDGAANMFGHSKEDTLGRSLFTVLPFCSEPAHRAAFTARMKVAGPMFHKHVESNGYAITIIGRPLERVTAIITQQGPQP